MSGHRLSGRICASAHAAKAAASVPPLASCKLVANWPIPGWPTARHINNKEEKKNNNDRPKNINKLWELQGVSKCEGTA